MDDETDAEDYPQADEGSGTRQAPATRPWWRGTGHGRLSAPGLVFDDAEVAVVLERVVTADVRVRPVEAGQGIRLVGVAGLPSLEGVPFDVRGKADEAFVAAVATAAAELGAEGDVWVELRSLPGLHRGIGGAAAACAAIGDALRAAFAEETAGRVSAAAELAEAAGQRVLGHSPAQGHARSAFVTFPDGGQRLLLPRMRVVWAVPAEPVWHVPQVRLPGRLGPLGANGGEVIARLAAAPAAARSDFTDTLELVREQLGADLPSDSFAVLGDARGGVIVLCRADAAGTTAAQRAPRLLRQHLPEAWVVDGSMTAAG